MPLGYGETAPAFSIVVSRHSFSIHNIWYRRKTALKTVALTILLLMVALPSRENPVSANQGSQTIPFPASLLIYSIINIRMGGYDCKLRELIQIPAAGILIHFNNASALFNACHCTGRVVPLHKSYYSWFICANNKALFLQLQYWVIFLRWEKRPYHLKTDPLYVMSGCSYSTGLYLCCLSSFLLPHYCISLMSPGIIPFPGPYFDLCFPKWFRKEITDFISESMMNKPMH